AGRGRVLGLVGAPPGRAGGEQEVDAAALEHGRGLAVGVVPEVADEGGDVQVVGGQPVDVQVVVVVRGRDHVRGAVVVVERDVPRHVAERAEAAVVGVRPVHGRRGGHGGAGLVVVHPVLLVHPHDEPAGGGVVDDLRPLDVG